MATNQTTWPAGKRGTRVGYSTAGCLLEGYGHSHATQAASYMMNGFGFRHEAPNGLMLASLISTPAPSRFVLGF